MLLAGESMVMTLKPMTHKKRRSKEDKIKIIDTFGSIHKKTSFSSKFCSTSEKNSKIFLDIQELHKVTVPTNQGSSQSEIPTSGYGQKIERRTF